MGGKREKGVWAIKSCPQMAGVGSTVRFELSTSLSLRASSQTTFKPLTVSLNGENLLLIPVLFEMPSLMHLQANLPNLRRLFVEARTEVEENEYSRTAV